VGVNATCIAWTVAPIAHGCAPPGGHANLFGSATTNKSQMLTAPDRFQWSTPQPGLCPAAVALRAASITRADGFL